MIQARYDDTKSAPGQPVDTTQPGAFEHASQTAGDVLAAGAHLSPSPPLQDMQRRRTLLNSMNQGFCVFEMLGRHLDVTRCCFIEVDEATDRWVIHRDYRATPGLPSIAGTRTISAYPAELVRTVRSGQVVAIGDTVGDLRTAAFARQACLLLDLSRIQAGRLTIEPRPIDLVAMLDRVVSEARPTTTIHELYLRVPPTPLQIDADPLRLEQVIQNLLANAVKYSPDGGPIEIVATVDADSVLITITDQGIGIPTTALPHLFTRFYRAPNATARAATSSMGIGLYVVRELVQAHGGSVAVDSVEGAGSTFTIRLQLKRSL